MTVSVRLHSKSHRQISKCQNFPRVWHLVIFRADQSKKHPLQLFGCSKTSSSLWLAMTLIGALPSVYSALKASTKREGPSNIVKAQEISPTFWNLVTMDLELWFTTFDQLELSVIVWIFFKLTLVSVLCSTIMIKGYNWGLIGYSYLVLGTRSAAKFETVPSTNFNRLNTSHK